MGKEYILWVIVYAGASLGHRQKAESTVIQVPTLLWLMCGKPLPDRKVQLLPLILQSSMITMLVAGMARIGGVMSRRVELIIIAICVLGALLGAGYAVISFRLRRSSGTDKQDESQ